MSIQTWFTQPPTSFSSYYYYDTKTRGFVRIRLELNRPDDGDPKIMVYRNRYVAFVNRDIKFDYKDYKLWTVEGNNIKYKNDILSNVIHKDLKVIDFTLEHGEDNPSHVHHGNPITIEFKLPKKKNGEYVTVDMLKTIAEYYIVLGKNKVICDSTDNEAELADAIFHIYHEIQK